MKKSIVLKGIVLTIFLLTAFVGSAQSSLNKYKYVVVPKKFDDFKKENQYQTSTIVKYLFSQKGFITVYDDNLPEDLSSDRCLGLYANLINNSSMFTTKTVLELKDCSNQEVFITEEGKSKKKDYKESYNEAIRKAFDSFASLDYSFEPKEEAIKEEAVTVSFKDDVKTVEESSDMNNNQDPMVEQIATEDVQYYEDRTPVESNYEKVVDKTAKEIVEPKTAKEEQSVESTETFQSDVKNANSVTSAKTITGILYAQAIDDGYQLVDSTPKIQLKIFKSSMPNVYIAKGDGKNGVVYTSDGKWFFEFYEGNNVIREELDIKF